MLALTRRPSAKLAECELTHLDRTPIDVARAAQQHDAYEARLRELGVTVERLPDLDAFPDGVFVEDTAIVLPELAVMCRPGAASRRGEVVSAEQRLAKERSIARIAPPATVDGGDVLRLGRTLFVGVGRRTSAEGAAQLEQAVGPHGYRVVAIAIDRCLHLKTAVTEVGDGAIVVNPAWIDPAIFGARTVIEVAADEPFGANVLRVGDAVVCATHHPRTAERIAATGARVSTVETSELAKAEAGLTCCSLLLD